MSLLLKTAQTVAGKYGTKFNRDAASGSYVSGQLSLASAKALVVALEKAGAAKASVASSIHGKALVYLVP